MVKRTVVVVWCGWIACAAGVASLPARQKGAPSPAQADSAIYSHVSHLGWVVRDVDAVVKAWRDLGVTDIRDAGVQEFPDVVYRGKPVTARVKKAFARFENGTIQWIQPLNQGTAYADFLAATGEGVQHVAFSVPTGARLDEELARYKALGIDVVQSGSWKGDAGTGRFAYLDTHRMAGA
jgi:methylmalonyl-CoA/ethylmalonyl-CoA epimerase